MATYKRNKSGGSQSEGASNSASPASSVALSSNPGSTQGINNNAPKYGTLVPNRIFVGGISSNTTEAELSQLFSKYGNVKATKIIADRAGVSKGYGFVTFESEEEVKFLIQDANNIVLKERRLNIAPAIKKQPFSRSFDASSPPPTTPNLYFHNGVPYTFHNGMAFFPPTPHQPTLALPPSADIYPSYGPTQSAAPAPYGTPLLVPAHPPVFMPQNFSYQPMPMTNGNPTQFIYTGSGSPNSSSGSPMAGTPENPPLPPHMAPPHFYTQQYATQEAYFPQPMYITYAFTSNDYEAQDQQTPNDDCSSTVSTPHTDISERSSNRSPANSPFMMAKNKGDQTGGRTDVSSNKEQKTKPQSNSDSQVPVVSWQNLKNHAEERELLIRDGRRSFYPIIPPPPPPRPDVMLYQQPTFPGSFPSPNNMYQQMPIVVNPRGQRQNSRGRTRFRDPVNSMPVIPKFPASFNNNNPLATNNNFLDKKPMDVSSGRLQRPMSISCSRGRGMSRGNHHMSPPYSNPNPTNTSPSPQMMQPPQDHRPIMIANPAPRWSSSPMTSHPLGKRIVCSKRQNGSNPNLGVTGNSGAVRLSKKTQGGAQDSESDVGGGGDAQPFALPPSAGGANQEMTSKMQTLSLSSS